MSTQQVGGWLRHAREARGLTVEAIASQTKIPPRHLVALERGDALALPAFYQRAEVRAVARAVGVDERLAVAQLEAELAPAVEPPPPAPSQPAPARVRSEYVLGMVGVGVLVVALAGWGGVERPASEVAREAPEPVAITASPAASLVSEALRAAPVEPGAPIGPTQLVITTQPVGARVTVDGIGWGESPITIRHLEPGEKRIRVSMDGYTSIERSIIVDEGTRETLRISLRKP